MRSGPDLRPTTYTVSAVAHRRHTSGARSTASHDPIRQHLQGERSSQPGWLGLFVIWVLLQRCVYLENRFGSSVYDAGRRKKVTVDQHDWLTQASGAPCHLRGVAYRMLGRWARPRTAVEETWIRLARSDGEGISNLGGWLTTVTSRVCMDMCAHASSRPRRIRSTCDVHIRLSAGRTRMATARCRATRMRAARRARGCLARTSSASPTESASTACCSGSFWSALLTIGSGTCTSSGSSRRVARRRSMSRHTREVTVVSHHQITDAIAVRASQSDPGLLHGVLGSPSEPSIRYATPRKWARCS